jgi:hypothetical protein
MKLNIQGTEVKMRLREIEKYKRQIDRVRQRERRENCKNVSLAIALFQL